jgi:hypothetical protein
MAADLVGKLVGRMLSSGSKSAFPAMLRSHFQADVQKLPIVPESFEFSDQPNLHLALESYLKEPDRSAEEPGDGLIVADRHLNEAMRELVVKGGALTRSLLGAEIQ